MSNEIQLLQEIEAEMTKLAHAYEVLAGALEKKASDNGGRNAALGALAGTAAAMPNALAIGKGVATASQELPQLYHNHKVLNRLVAGGDTMPHTRNAAAYLENAIETQKGKITNALRGMDEHGLRAAGKIGAGAALGTIGAAGYRAYNQTKAAALKDILNALEVR